MLELGCGLGLPSIVAAREGASVLATDGSSDAVVFAAHSLALNELDGEVAEVDWATQGDALVARGPWDVVLAADVLYLKASVEPRSRCCRGSWPRAARSGSPTRGARAPATSSPPRGRASSVRHSAGRRDRAAPPPSRAGGARERRACAG